MVIEFRPKPKRERFGFSMTSWHSSPVAASQAILQLETFLSPSYCCLNAIRMILLLAFVLCTGTIASPAAANDKDTEPLPLGAIVSLTGPAAEQGRSWLNGALLAAKVLQEEEKLKVALHLEDDNSRAATVPLAFEKLVQFHNVRGVIGGTWDFLAGAAAPLAKRHSIPFITPTNPIEVIQNSASDNPWYFTNGLSIRATEEAMQRVVKSLGAKSSASFVISVPFGLLHAEAFERAAKITGGTVVLRSTFDFAGSTDALKSFALKVAKQKPDLVLCVVDHAGLVTFVRELRRLGYSGAVLTTQHLEEAATLSGQPELWKNVVGLYPQQPPRSFIERYRSEYGHTPKVYAAEGYDATVFLARALHQGVNLGKTSFTTTGILGTLRSHPGSHELGTTVAIPMTMAHGKLTPFTTD